MEVDTLNKQDFLTGGGEMEALIRSFNWAGTAIGTPDHWPPCLRTAINVVLNAHFPMYIAWGPSYIQFYNEEYKPILGAGKHPKALGQSAREAFKEAWHYIEPVFREVMQGKPVRMNDVLLPVNHQVLNEAARFAFSYIPLYDDNGHVGGIMAIATVAPNEISHKTEELRQMNRELELRNEELRRSEERYVRMTNEVEDYAIILLSKDGYIENWNKGAEKIKGYTASEIIGKHISVFYTERDQQEGLPYRLINEAREKGKSTYEGWRLRKDGSEFWGNVVITALHDEKNEVTGFSKVTRDLTERKIAEDQLKMYAEQLELKNKELERSNSELSSFSYVASHDLQEPLRKIQAFGNLIQARDAEHMSELSRDYFDRMVKAAVRMQNLIDSLLEFSRTTTAHKSFEVTDLNSLLDEVKKELADRLEEKKAVIRSARLPVLTVIPFQFRQLLSNLINNSLKYARHDVLPVIDIRVAYIRAKEMKAEKDAVTGKDYYKFSVTDNGIGFEQEYAEKIFELFQRLHGRNEYAGSGIGLAICKKIIENHHGFIRAESEPERGAAFHFFIPVR